MMKYFYLIMIYAISVLVCSAQFKTTFTHDVNGNRVQNVTVGQSGEVMSNILSVQSLPGDQAMFKWQSVPSVSNYLYEYSSSPTKVFTNATDATLAVPTADYLQFAVSNTYANNRCVVADWKNLRTGPIETLTTGNWHTPFTWDCNCIPTALNTAAIKNGHIVTIDGRTGFAAKLQVAGLLTFLNRGAIGFGQ